MRERVHLRRNRFTAHRFTIELEQAADSAHAHLAR
jgi:hypothetical protein